MASQRRALRRRMLAMQVVRGDFTLESCRRCLQLLRAEEEAEARALWAERARSVRAL
jgi:hypothetical protein